MGVQTFLFLSLISTINCQNHEKNPEKKKNYAEFLQSSIDNTKNLYMHYYDLFYTHLANKEDLIRIAPLTLVVIFLIICTYIFANHVSFFRDHRKHKEEFQIQKKTPKLYQTMNGEDSSEASYATDGGYKYTSRIIQKDDEKPLLQGKNPRFFDFQSDQGVEEDLSLSFNSFSSSNNKIFGGFNDSHDESFMNIFDQIGKQSKNKK